MQFTSLKHVKQRLKSLDREKRKNNKKENHLYNKINKDYKKIDWSPEKINNRIAKEIFTDSVYPVWRNMLSFGILKFHPIGNSKSDGFYIKTHLEDLLLVQELMCQMDEQYWCTIQPVNWKPEYVPYYFDSAYRGKTWICQIPVSKVEKSKLVTDFLKTKEYLFDEDSPFFKGHNKTRKFIEKNLFNGKPEKWDYYLKRFLRENNK